MKTHVMLDVDGVVVSGRPSDGKPWRTDLLADLGIDPDMLDRTFFEAQWPQIVIGALPLRPTLDTALGQIGATVTARVH